MATRRLFAYMGTAKSRPDLSTFQRGLAAALRATKSVCGAGALADRPQRLSSAARRGEFSTLFPTRDFSQSGRALTNSWLVLRLADPRISIREARDENALRATYISPVIHILRDTLCAMKISFARACLVRNIYRWGGVRAINLNFRSELREKMARRLANA